jgi:hypothetical protein
MTAQKTASDVNTVHSDVPDSSAVLDKTDLEADNKVDGMSDKLNDNNKSENQPPPIRDVGYWWITLVCVVLGVVGPIIYYIESFNIYEGRYFQAVTCVFLLLLCVKLFNFCKYDVEVNSLIGVIILWAWLLYGVIEWGRILIVGTPALIIGMIHVMILVLTQYGKSKETVIKCTGLEIWIWVSVVICLILPVNVSTRMSAKEGIMFSHIFLIVWFLEMLYQGLVEKEMHVRDLFFKTIPVLRLPLMISTVYVLVVLAWRVYACLGFSKQYQVPKKIKTTPMSLYEGVEKMFPDEPKETSSLIVERPGLVNRKPEVAVQVVQEKVETPQVKTEPPRAAEITVLRAVNKPLLKAQPLGTGSMMNYGLGVKKEVSLPSVPKLQNPEQKKRLNGFNLSFLS